MRFVSRALMMTGFLLLAFWALARAHSEIGSAQAIAEFSNSTAGPGPQTGTDVDTSLWSPQRIASFKGALGVPSDPPLAVISIPRVGVEAPLYKGTDEITLNRGLGWIPGTAAPGTAGNTGIAAHRDGFFRALKDIAVNDVIEVKTHDGVQTFHVQECSIVAKTAVGVLAPAKEPMLTLVTCYPFYYVGPAPQRFIVRAVLQAQVASGRGAGSCPNDCEAPTANTH
jgi:sortase A